MRITIEIDTSIPLTEDGLLLLRGLAGAEVKPAGRAPNQFLDHDGKPFVPATSVAHPGFLVDLSEGTAKDVPCLHFANADGVCGRCGEQVTAPAEEAPADPPKRKRRTKAEMEAARAAENAAEQDETTAPEPDQADGGQADAPEDEAVSEPSMASQVQEHVTETMGVRTIDKWREEAVAKATEAVAAGNRKAVKDALESVGATRVSTLGDDQLAAFLAALTE